MATIDWRFSTTHAPDMLRHIYTSVSAGRGTSCRCRNRTLRCASIRAGHGIAPARVTWVLGGGHACSSSVNLLRFRCAARLQLPLSGSHYTIYIRKRQGDACRRLLSIYSGIAGGWPGSPGAWAMARRVPLIVPRICAFPKCCQHLSA